MPETRNDFDETALPNTDRTGRAVSPRPPQMDMESCGAFGERALPVRKKLSHEIPNWVKDGAIYFVTINCARRTLNQLAHPAIANAVEQSLLHRQNLNQWWIHLFLLMPDHAHGLISFGREFSMRRTITDWKRYLSCRHGIEWQREFFDHRLRDDASLTEKWHYIRNNPVRQNLVEVPEQWPYQWHNGRARSPNAPQSSTF